MDTFRWRLNHRVIGLNKQRKVEYIHAVDETMKLIREGFFRELPYGELEGPKIADAVGNVSILYKKKIISYLRSGKAIIAAPGISKDVLTPVNKIIGGMAILTDGVFCWPKDLAYYVDNYEVGITEVFLNYMILNEWRIPEIDLLKLEV